MRIVFKTCWFALAAAGLLACSPAKQAASGDASSHPSDVLVVGGFACTSCVADEDCGKGRICSQVFGSSWCADPCGDLCPGELICKQVQSSSGVGAEVCVPVLNPCTVPDEPVGQPADSGLFFDPNDIHISELPPPQPVAALDLFGVTKLSRLEFAVVGDTRPAFKNYTNSYPTAVITQIYQAVAAENPPAAFVLTTGDFQFSAADKADIANAQFDKYLSARALYPGTVLPVIGNHECTGATDSNCGPGSKDGSPPLYQTYLKRMLEPTGLPTPYYVVRLAAEDESWTAKVVVIAANVWSADQAEWLQGVLQSPTTYTLAVRHEPRAATEAPGVAPSNALLDKYPLTLLIAGHTHTAAWHIPQRELVVGNGGAPANGTMPYGYAMIRRREDSALQFEVYHYQTHATLLKGAVWPTGTVAP